MNHLVPSWNYIDKLYQYYSDVVPGIDGNNITKIGEVSSYYLADTNKTNIYTTKLFYVDIKSAAPSLCNCIFDNSHNNWFIEKLNSFENKLDKNMFLTNILKTQSDNYLSQFTGYYKIVLFNYIFNNYENIDMIEYIKDGALFSGEKINPKIPELNIFLDQHFKFHLDNIDAYLRYNKTSFYKQSNNLLTTKGILKNPPTAIINYLDNVLSKGDPYLEFKYIDYYKDHELFKIFKHLNINQDYYKFNNKNYLDNSGKLVPSFNQCNPFAILQYIVYPFLVLLRV